MIRHRVRTARVPHICEGCIDPIPVGRQHIESTASPDSDAGGGSWTRFRCCAHCAEQYQLGHLFGPMHGPIRQIGDYPTHFPCCSSHNVDMDCATYRRTHFVEVRPCCDAWDATATWIPRGCPAGFSANCSDWTSNGLCKCWTPPEVTAQEPAPAPAVATDTPDETAPTTAELVAEYFFRCACGTPGCDREGYAAEALDVVTAALRDEVGRLRTERDALADILANVELYVNWRFVTKQLTTEQKEIWADAVEAWNVEPGEDRAGRADRWWRDDAPAPVHPSAAALRGEA